MQSEAKTALPVDIKSVTNTLVLNHFNASCIIPWAELKTTFWTLNFRDLLVDSFKTEIFKVYCLYDYKVS